MRNLMFETKNLSQEHRDALIAGGFDSRMIDGSNFYTVTDPKEAAALLNWSGNGPVPALVIPYKWRYDAATASWVELTKPYTRLRPDSPREITRSSGKVQVCKYESPKGSSSELYCPRDVLPEKGGVHFWDNHRTVTITEGEKKALVAARLGNARCVIAVPGVSNFGDPNHDPEAGEVNLHPTLAGLAAAGGYEFRIAYDSDQFENPNVLGAAVKLAARLIATGSKVSWFSPHPEWKGKGLDDQIVETGAPDWREYFGPNRQDLDSGHTYNDKGEGTRSALPAQLLADLVAARQRYGWTKDRTLVEATRAAKWVRAFAACRETAGLDSGRAAMKLKAWVRTLCDQLDVKIKPAAIHAAIKGSTTPDSGLSEATDSRPWATRAWANGSRYHEFSDGSSLPAGDSELTSGAVFALARFLIGKLGPLSYHQGGFLRYDGGAWAPLSKSALAREISRLDGEETAGGDSTVTLGGQSVSYVAAAMRSILAADSETFWAHEASPRIAFASQTIYYDFEAKAIAAIAHDPANRARIKYDFDYVPDAHPARWLDATAAWFATPESAQPDWTADRRARDSEAKIALVHEWVGRSLLFGARNVGRALFLVGGRGLGKSTILQTLASLWPRESVATVPVSDFGREYQMAALATASLNVVGELDAAAPASVAVLKSLVSCSDSISARAPYGEPFSYRSRTSQLFAANQWPELRDYSGAVWDRFAAIRLCGQRFRGTPAEDRNFAAGLAAERAEIVSHCLAAAARAAAAGTDLPFPESSESELEDAAAEVDPVRCWLEERVEFGPEFRAIPRELFNDYNEWADANGRGQLSTTRLGSALKSHGVPKRKTKTGAQYQCRVKPLSN
jgi:hypothetical protein